MRSLFAFTIPAAAFLALALSAPALAQTDAEKLDASPRHQEWVTLTFDGDKKLSAFVVHPESKEATDSIVVIHDIRAMSDWIRVVADKLAEAGYVAIVPDLLSGMGPDGGNTDSFAGNDEVGRAIRELDKDRITAALKACVEYVRALPSTTDVVSVGGFCWGGAESFRYATNDQSIKAAFVFYGSPPEKEAMAKINCPVYGFYGENDNRINSTIEDTKKTMAEHGKTYEIVIYPGTGHGFLKSGMAADADDNAKKQTAAAWDRWLSLLKK